MSQRTTPAMPTSGVSTSGESDNSRPPRLNINPLLIVGGSLSFIAGLSWNDAIKTLIDGYYPGSSRESIEAKLVYALVVTLFVILFALFLNYLNEKAFQLQKGLAEHSEVKKLSQEYKE